MAAPNVRFFANITTSDYDPNRVGQAGFGNACTGVPSQSWMQITLAQTTLVFTGTGVQEGQGTGSRDPIIIPASGSVEAPKTFLDVAANTGGGMFPVPLAGTQTGSAGHTGGAHIAVFAVAFQGSTAGSPFLEYWDTDSLTSTQYQCLGSNIGGTPYIRGYACQDSQASPIAPDAEWGGTPLAGGGANRLRLYYQAVPAAPSSGWTVCYYNLKVLIPQTASPFNESPVCILRYTYN